MKRHWMSISLIVVLLLSFLIGSPGVQADSLGNHADEWQDYADADYAFSLQYPSTWRAEITIDVRHPSPQPEWILRRHTFVGTAGAFDLDIWAAQDMELTAWMKWLGGITTPFLVTEPNAMVAGYPAVAFVENEMLTVIFSDSKYVYRLWYTALYTASGLHSYQHLLNTLQLHESLTVGAQMSQSVIQDMWESVEMKGNCTVTAGCTSVYNAGCCGLSSAFCSTYFPCSRESGADKGNCTWYVCYRYGNLPFRGDAGTWWGQVPTYGWQWNRGPAPRMNSRNIGWWPEHVAFVPYYTGGTPIIYEMAWCLTCARLRPGHLSLPYGYIWEHSPPQPTIRTDKAR